MSTAELETEIRYASIQRFPGYKFGSDGSVWSLWRKGPRRRGIIGDAWRKLKPSPDSRGYPIISLRDSDGSIKRNQLVHRLILEAFRGSCPDGMEGRHFPDRTRTNCALANLIWGTRSQNHADKWPQGTMPHGESHQNSKLTTDSVREIRRRCAAGESQVALASEFGTHQTNISLILKGEAWSWLR